jgi:hypothetical protein
LPLGPALAYAEPVHPDGKTLLDIRREDAVPIVDDEAVRMIARQGFPELRQRPFRRGMGRGVEVENLAGSDLHDNENVAVITTKKSKATIALEWLWTKVSQR